MEKDTIFTQPQIFSTGFQFDDRVAAVFADMIRRSVPGYENIVAMLRVLAERFVTPGSNVYDLGCSLGASALSMAAGMAGTGCRIYAVDNSSAMISRCRDHIAAFGLQTTIEPLCADIRELDIDRASMVVVNFTMQFLPVEDRESLLKKIYSGMLPGGILVLSEKITHDEPFTRDLLIDVYHAWKQHNGYSELEISRKRTALENVLIPETQETHRARLERIGFRHCEQWFQCFNFISLMAFK